MSSPLNQMLTLSTAVIFLHDSEWGTLTPSLIIYRIHAPNQSSPGTAEQHLHGQLDLLQDDSIYAVTTVLQATETTGTGNASYRVSKAYDRHCAGWNWAIIVLPAQSGYIQHCAFSGFSLTIPPESNAHVYLSSWKCEGHPLTLPLLGDILFMKRYFRKTIQERCL